jgi:hypothetical protein
MRASHPRMFNPATPPTSELNLDMPSPCTPTFTDAAAFEYLLSEPERQFGTMRCWLTYGIDASCFMTP